MRATAAEVLAAFDAADIEARVLKGLATAELDYPNPLLRQLHLQHLPTVAQ